MKPTQYTCDFYPVRAADITHAAQLFAVQMPRQKYGPKGRCRSVQMLHDVPSVGATTFEASSAFWMELRGGAGSPASRCDRARLDDDHRCGAISRLISSNRLP
jgi:hypothetical protein